ncbi:MAG: TIGR04552 family protein [Myxococcota bacterium]
MANIASSLELDFSLQPYLPVHDLKLMDVEAVRLMLRGDSIIDWHRMNFQSREEVQNFLRVNLFEPDAIQDQRRFRYLHQEAIQYLRNYFNLRIPKALVEPPDVESLFLHASFAKKRFNRYQLLSCVILKVMSILHHIEGRSLLFRTPISDLDLFALVQDRVDAFSELAQRIDVPLVQIYGSRKSRDSLVTKLLSKKDTIAATIFDKLRYRIVVERREDLFPMLSYMTHTFLPYNYTIPNESNNNLLNLWEELQARVDLHELMDGMVSNYRWQEDRMQGSSANIFSGSSYRTINFIVDLPVRLDAFLSQEDMARYGRIGFVLVEFQVVDEQTEASNDQGENSHELYKRRQRDKVLERLRWGGLIKLRNQQREQERRALLSEELPPRPQKDPGDR